MTDVIRQRFINTALQRGEHGFHQRVTASAVLRLGVKTAETVVLARSSITTSLKRGVNEGSAMNNSDLLGL
jgi:hypothetical protein